MSVVNAKPLSNAQMRIIYLPLCAPIALMDILKISNLSQDSDIQHTNQTEYTPYQSYKEFAFDGNFCIVGAVLPGGTK